LHHDFYEVNLLNNISDYIKPNSIILDIGSNIGNHTLYFKKILNARKVYAFEPQTGVFSILMKNIELNKLSDVTVFNIGLGAKNTNGSIDFDGKIQNNLGGTSIREDKEGELVIKKLDDVGIEDKIDFIKIDTEGFEVDVLTGAIQTIKKSMPYIWVETFDNRYNQVFDILSSVGYVLKESYEEGNYLFIPKCS
jgi:FkbM family methyltransferase